MIAMHVPDGFLDATTSIATGAVAAGAVGLSLQKANAELRESGPALAGLTSVFVFAVQMVNFPVGAGTSGHLMGGALAAALVGPWTAVLVMAVVMIVQALFFADGGLTALGTNFSLIAIVTVLAGYLVTRGLLMLLPKRPGSVVPAAGVAAFVSVPLAAFAFVGLYAVGGAVPIPLGSLTAAMVGWHTLIGIGEALITAAVVGAVVATRPDLVYAVRHLRRDLVLVDADGRTTTVTPDAPVQVQPGRRPLAIGLAVSLLIAGVVSLFASARPDGLESVAQGLGFAHAANDSAVASSPLAGYGFSLAGNGLVAGALAGLIGVLITGLVALALTALARRGRGEAKCQPEPARSDA
jgi:cobalt/nickel transport system permease protein